MTSDIYFTATSWFPGKCPRKTPFKAQWGGELVGAQYCEKIDDAKRMKL